jgi:ribonuclease HI
MNDNKFNNYSDSSDIEQNGGRKPSTFTFFNIFIDGSASNQAETFHQKHLRRAGIGIYHPDSGTRIAQPFPLPNPTNNRAEYWACITALEWVLENTKHLGLKKQSQVKVVLYTDSMLLINTMTKWVKGWKKKGWKKSDGKPVLNKELVEKMDDLLTNRLPKTTFIKVKAHKKMPPRTAGVDAFLVWNGNRIADELANQGRKIAEAV